MQNTQRNKHDFPGFVLMIILMFVFLMIGIMMFSGCDNTATGPETKTEQTDNTPQHTLYRYRITVTNINNNTSTYEGNGIEYFNEAGEDMIHVFQDGCGISIPQVVKNVKHYKIEIIN